MKYFLIIVGLFVAYIFYLGLFGEGSEDVKDASKIGISINKFRKFQEIDKKIAECTRAGKTPPSNLFDDVTNMNDWRRFCNYMHGYKKRTKRRN